jgi:hypothetical protein
MNMKHWSNNTDKTRASVASSTTHTTQAVLRNRPSGLGIRLQTSDQQSGHLLSTPSYYTAEETLQNNADGYKSGDLEGHVFELQ